ncbi:hypothetical protein QQG55_53940 [Brugia pahangi]
MVDDLSAESFLTALRRFVARRGYPELILSDNATQFQAVFQAIKTQESQLSNFLAEKGIKCKTITQSTMERRNLRKINRLTKRSLRRAIGRRLLKEGELITLIIEVESILNTRPLTYVNFDDSIILRPIDFIIPNASLSILNSNNDREDEFSPYSLTTQKGYFSTGRIP